ncbi:MAG: Tad domain-containing protein [Candidatus Eremiobacteraeota bacterium]|nr:Tad domain-containing protein [Candidatus Eremiobacteraeota bacterium]
MSRHSQSGQTLPFVAVIIAMLLAVAGLAADTAYLRYEQRIQQTAADSGAIHGAMELIAGTNVTNAARNAASTNGFTDNGGTTTVTVNNPPSAVAADPENTNSKAVEVVVTVAQPSFFTKILGLSGANVATRAIAAASTNDNGCFYMLDASQNTNFNNSTLSASGCAININGTANFHGATVTASFVGCGGVCSNAGGVSPQPTTIVPASDPCQQIPGCVSLTNSPPSQSSCSATLKKGSTVANPGCYSSMNLNKGTVTLNPGLYILTGSADWSKATVTGSGVTIYLAAGASLNASNSTIALAACTTTLSPAISCTNSAVNNIVFYEPPANTNAPNFNGSATSLTGVFYAPSADGVNFNGSGGGYSVIIVGSANFNGSTSVYAHPPTNASYIYSAVLVE